MKRILKLLSLYIATLILTTNLASCINTAIGQINTIIDNNNYKVVADNSAVQISYHYNDGSNDVKNSNNKGEKKCYNSASMYRTKKTSNIAEKVIKKQEILQQKTDSLIEFLKKNRKE